MDYILDHEDVYDNLKAGRIYEGIIGFLNVAAQELGTPAAHNARAITVAAVISLLIGGIAATVVVVKYKRKLKSPSYPLERYARLSVTHASDKFLTRNVTRVKIQSSSGGGRSGGGGGGHRGGR
ncbi:MAG: hypothetical protein IIX96_02990 [Clostridia bacterium]|nr:hypothetical protein [Clostridia bacterium]